MAFCGFGLLGALLSSTALLFSLIIPHNVHVMGHEMQKRSFETNELPKITCVTDSSGQMKCDYDKKFELPSCSFRKGLMGLGEENDEFVMVEMEVGGTLILECHFCDDQTDPDAPSPPVAWYFRRHFNREDDYESEVFPDTRKDIDDQYTLTIRKFQVDDGGMYFCQGEGSSATKFEYLVDVVFSATNEPFRGTLEEYEHSDYYKDSRTTSRAVFGYMTSQDFRIKGTLSPFSMVLKMGPFGPCRVCGSTKGIQIQQGKCRIGLRQPDKENERAEARLGTFSKMHFGIQFSCHSYLLDRFLSPDLVKKVYELQNIFIVQECEGECTKPEIEISHESLENLDLNTFVTMEIESGTEVVLTCPKSELTDMISWVYGTNTFLVSNPEMESFQTENNITVVNEELLIPNMTMFTQGSFTCYSNLKMVKTYDIQLKKWTAMEVLTGSDQKNKQESKSGTWDVSWYLPVLGCFSLVSFCIWLIIIITIYRANLKNDKKGYNLVESRDEDDDKY